MCYILICLLSEYEIMSGYEILALTTILAILYLLYSFVDQEVTFDILLSGSPGTV